MAGPVATASVEVRPDTRGFESDLKSRVGGIAKSVGLAIGAAFTAQQGLKFLSSSVDEAREANKVTAITTATIKATGGAAGITAKHVDKLANAISRKTGVDDEAIQAGVNQLLTFKSIRNELGKNNDVFDRATRAALDLSKHGFGDLSSTSVQLGKALEDPVKGLTALTRVGVTFSNAEKQKIKALTESGDLLGAQKILLEAVEGQVKGTAEAQATAADRLKVTVGNLKESLGQGLIPVLDKVATFLADRLPGALDKAGKFFGDFTRTVSGVTTLFNNTFLRQFGSDPDITSDGVAGVMERSGLAIRNLVDTISVKLKPIIADIVAFVQTNMPRFQESFERVVNAVTAIFNQFQGTAIPVVEAVINTIVAVIGRVVAVIQEVALFVSNIINGDFAAAFGNLKNIVANEIGGVLDIVRGLVPALAGLVVGVVSAMASLGGDIIAGLVSGIRDKAGDVIGAIKKFVLDKVPKLVKEFFGIGSPSKMFAGFGANLMDGLADGITKAAGGPLGALGDVNAALTGPGAPGVGGAPIGSGSGAGGAVFGPGSVVVSFQGAVPSEAQALTTGQAVGRGITAEMDRLALRRAQRVA